MIDVKLPYFTAMIEVPCRESPLFVEDRFNPKLEKWLDSQIGDDWDWDYKDNDIVVGVPDKAIAVLLKLTWGGSY